ncbi:hypothetical protein V8E52_005154 [Russula decolorans]
MAARREIGPDHEVVPVLAKNSQPAILAAGSLSKERRGVDALRLIIRCYWLYFEGIGEYLEKLVVIVGIPLLEVSDSQYRISSISSTLTCLTSHISSNFGHGERLKLHNSAKLVLDVAVETIPLVILQLGREEELGVRETPLSNRRQYPLLEFLVNGKSFPQIQNLITITIGKEHHEQSFAPVQCQWRAHTGGSGSLKFGE